MDEKTKKNILKGIRIGFEVLGGAALITSIIKYDELVDDYNKLLSADKKLMEYVETHEAYYPKSSLRKNKTVEESPNPHWKDYHPSASMVHKAATDVETDLDDETKWGGVSVRTDKISGFRVISVNEEAKVCEGS